MITMKKSTLLHLRYPFSFFLLPIFLLGCAMVDDVILWKCALTFVILHFLIYPASNGYNSYFDKDKGSIGGLKFPPKTSKELYYVALCLDVIALLLGFLISTHFVAMLFIYGLVSKAYSHPSVRLKSKPIAGWLAAGFFQGYFTILITAVGVSGLELQQLWDFNIQIAAILASLMLFGSYPMTQIYQHQEDAERGDQTLSLKLGILNTFHFTAICFGVAMSLFFVFFMEIKGINTALIFAVMLVPILLYFARWYLQVRNNLNNADYDRTMRLNWLSAICLNLFFLYLFFS
jgi:1,4-dihydroxy-2-naphthoate octaprenyltransferase